MNKKGLLSGQVSRTFLILAICTFFIVVVVYLVLQYAQKPVAPVQEKPQAPQPVYETTVSNVKFTLQASRDRGNILRASEARNNTFFSNSQDLTSTEKFIEVRVGAQNTGRFNLNQGYWGLGDIVDSENKHFVALDSYNIGRWLPQQNYCGAMLKPDFDPLSCTRIYEVSKKSGGLKVTVISNSGNSQKAALLDLILTK